MRHNDRDESFIVDYLKVNRQYKMQRDSLQWRFQQSRAKIQIFGGGFANGKTTSSVIKTLQLAKAYPGMNCLIARSTYPKLNDTIRKEFIAWCPKPWIKRISLTDNVIVLKNDSTINFRYIAQQGKNNESTTSNLLSATYDLIVVDQVEDPEISHKDFLDLLGRLRGNTPYVGDDESMPRSGPRWMILTTNPTQNWVYRKLVRPLHLFQQSGVRHPDLLVDEEGNPIIELFEGSTYSNKDNLAADYIKTLEASYSGQTRSRYLDGNWGGYEGLVYPQYDAAAHIISHEVVIDYLRSIQYEGYMPEYIEAYDHGIAVPACYLQAFVDQHRNIIVVSGFYEKERTVEDLAKLIKHERAITAHHCVHLPEFGRVLADPAIFKRTGGTGATVSSLFRECNIEMTPARNSIEAGILKVQQYLTVDPLMINPFTKEIGSPRVFFSDNLHWLDTEISDYYWKKTTTGDYEDKPRDSNDHAMDALKYLLSMRPKVATLVAPVKPLPPSVFTWAELENTKQDKRMVRYGHKPY